MDTYKRWPIEIVSGSGARLEDSRGRTYLDFVAGIAVASVGHCHPRVTAAITEQAARLVHVSNLYSTGPQSELAERLAELSGGMQSFFCNSGAEAVETALKLARKWGAMNGKGARLLCTEGGFHGRTMGALSATGQMAKRAPFKPLVPGFTHVAYGDVDALKAAMDDDICALVLEVAQGEAGVVVPEPHYLASARALCDEWGALLVLDEVQTGVGRTGAWWGHQHYGVMPDVMCLAKGLAAGLPIGACLARPAVAAAFEHGDHGCTFGGGPVQCAAALATLDVIEEEGLVERAATLGARLLEELTGIFGDGVRGLGLLVGVELSVPLAQELAAEALERGLLINNATASVIRLCPPLIISDDDVTEAVQILGEAWHAIR